MRRVRLFWLVVLAACAACAATLYAAFDSKPAVLEPYAVQPADARRVRALIKQVANALLGSAPSAEVVTSAADLNAILGFIARALPSASGRVNISSNGLVGAITIAVPAGPFNHRYLNAHVMFEPTRAGSGLTAVALGDLRLAGRVAETVLATALDLALGDRVGSRLLQGIQAVEFDTDRVSVTFAPLPELGDRLDAMLHRVRAVRDRVAPLGEPSLIGLYYRQLAATSADLSDAAGLRLADHLPALFSLAAQRSTAGDAARENRAAILALATYFGNARYFERLIGAVRPHAKLAPDHLPPAVTLAGRRDLALHFAISAGLKVLADSGIAHSIGEFKELLDANRGGSGFSSADLAADRAGVYLATLAISDEHAARVQQGLAAAVGEADFFPSLADLPEGMSDSAFRARFGDVTDARYAALVAEIDARIARRPVYRGRGATGR